MSFSFLTDSKERFKPWTKTKAPRKILVIRFQAMGDVVITLPYINDLKKHFPDTRFHFLTRKEVSSIPKSLSLFDKVIVIKGGRNAKLQFILTIFKIPFLLFQRYDVVLDLQNHKISRFIVSVLNASSFCVFDRHSNRSAAERTFRAIENCMNVKISLAGSFKQNINESRLIELLRKSGWKENHSLIILNPAGAFETRHWPIANYVSLARLFKEKKTDVQFLVIGLKNKLAQSVIFIKEHLQDDVIDLTDATSPAEAFALVKKSKLIVTEDSGLMHMAWVQAVPTVAIFGSTRSYWSSPQGEWSVCLNSSDLPCGNCMLEVCKYHDNHCLTRYSPEFVFEKSFPLLSLRAN